MGERVRALPSCRHDFPAGWPRNCARPRARWRQADTHATLLRVMRLDRVNMSIARRWAHTPQYRLWYRAGEFVTTLDGAR